MLKLDLEYFDIQNIFTLLLVILIFKFLILHYYQASAQNLFSLVKHG